MNECGREEQRFPFEQDAEEVLRLTRRVAESPDPSMVDRIVERTIVTLNDARGHRAVRFTRIAIAASILAGFFILPWLMPGKEEKREIVRTVVPIDIAVDAAIRDLKSATERFAGSDHVVAASNEEATDDMIVNVRYAIARQEVASDPAIDNAIAHLRYRTEAMSDENP